MLKNCLCLVFLGVSLFLIIQSINGAEMVKKSSENNDELATHKEQLPGSRYGNENPDERLRDYMDRIMRARVRRIYQFRFGNLHHPAPALMSLKIDRTHNVKHFPWERNPTDNDYFNELGDDGNSGDDDDDDDDDDEDGDDYDHEGYNGYSRDKKFKLKKRHAKRNYNDDDDGGDFDRKKKHSLKKKRFGGDDDDDDSDSDEFDRKRRFKA